MLKRWSVLLVLGCMAFGSTAQAAEVDRYSGTYALACRTAKITASLSATGGVGTNSGSGSVPFSVQLSCDKDDPEFLDALAEAAANLEATCESLTGGLFPKCAEAADSYAQALYDLNARLVDLIPVSASLKVGASGDWGNILFNLYPFNGSALNGIGETVPVNLFINRSGTIAAAGIGVGNGDSVGNGEAGLGCLAWGTASINGHISASNQYSFSATYGMNANLTCGGAHQTGAWFLVNIGAGYTVTVAGAKTPAAP